MSDPARRFILDTLLPRRQLLVALMMFAALAWLLCAQTIPQLTTATGAAEPPGAATPPDDLNPPTTNAPPPTEKQIKAYSGLAALVGIVIAGLSLVALIILWAGRLRRQIRRPLPESGLPARDFWFLKPPKPTVTDSNLPDSHQPHHQPPDQS
jgi:hypothetical protein